MSTSSTTWPRSALFLSAALVLMSGYLIFQPRAALVCTDSPLSDQAVLQELRHLAEVQSATTRVLERMESKWAFAAQPLAERSSLLPTDASEASSAAERLTLNLVRLADSLEQHSKATHALLEETSLEPPESLFELKQRRNSTNWGALEGLLALWEEDQEAASRSQYFLTPRDLLETYGPPTAIYRPKSGILYHYRRQAEGVPGPNWYFRLQEGSVIEFFIEENDGEDD